MKRKLNYQLYPFLENVEWTFSKCLIKLCFYRAYYNHQSQLCKVSSDLEKLEMSGNFKMNRTSHGKVREHLKMLNCKSGV